MSDKTSPYAPPSQMSPSGWALGLLLVTLACGEASTAGDDTGTGGTSSGGTSSSGAFAGESSAGGSDMGGSNMGGSDMGGSDTSDEPPACTTDFAFNSNGDVTVTGQPNLGRAQRARVLEIGVGVPPELENITVQDGPVEGWLRVVELNGGADDSDAGDAGAPDVLGIERLVLGPSELGQLPVAVGDEIEVSNESEAQGPFDYDQRTVIRQAGRTLLLRHYSTVGERMFGLIGGVLLAPGPLVCSAPVGAQPGSDARCADMNVHQLEVTVPSGPTAPGATATLDAGESKTIGDYRVIHGNTYQLVSPRVYAASGSCPAPSAGVVIVTVVLAP